MNKVKSFIIELINNTKEVLFDSKNKRMKEFKKNLPFKLKRNSNFLSKIPNEFKEDQNFIINIIEQFPKYKYEEYHQKFFNNFGHMINNKRIMLEIVEQNGDSIKYASESLKDDEDIALQAIKSDIFAFVHISPRLKDDEKLVLKSIKRNPFILENASERLQHNKKMLLFAVGRAGLYFEKVPKEFKNDKELALVAYKNTTEAVKYFSDSLKMEIGDNDVIKYLESAILRNQLESEMGNSLDNIKTKRIKI